MSSEFAVILSSALIAMFSVLFVRQLRELEKRSFVTEPNPLLFKLIPMMYHTYRNRVSSFMALTRLDNACRVLPQQLRLLARKLSLGRDVEPATFNPLFLNVGLSDPLIQDEWKANDLLFREAMRDLRKKLFTTNVRNIITLALTGIIIAPVIVTISALFHQKEAIELLPIVTSLFYGIALQVIMVVLKRYALILV